MKNIRSILGIALSVMTLMSVASSDAVSWNSVSNWLSNTKNTVVAKANNLKNATVYGVKLATNAVVTNAYDFKDATVNGIKSLAASDAVQKGQANIASAMNAVSANAQNAVTATTNAFAKAGTTAANAIVANAQNSANFVKDAMIAHPTATKIAVAATVAPTIIAGAVKGTQAVIDYKTNQQKKLIAYLADEMTMITEVISKNLESNQAQPFKLVYDWKNFEANLAKLTHVGFKAQLQTLMSKIKKMYDVTIDYANKDTRNALSRFAQECLDAHQAGQNLLNDLKNQKTVADSIKKACWAIGYNVSNATQFAGAKIAQAGHAIKDAVSPHMTVRNALIATTAIGAGVAYKTGAAQSFYDAARKEIKNLKHVNWSDLASTTGQYITNGLKHSGNKIIAGVSGLAGYAGKNVVETDVANYLAEQSTIDLTAVADQPVYEDCIAEALNVLQEQALEQAEANEAANGLTNIITGAVDYVQQNGFTQEGIAEVISPVQVDNVLAGVADAANVQQSQPQTIVEKTVGGLNKLYQQIVAPNS